MQAVIELQGGPGTGKTTLAGLLGEELSPAVILFIDASPDQRLTLTHSPQPVHLTLGQLLNNRQDVTAGSREAIDWAFHDMLVSAGEEMDLLTVGALGAEIGILEREKLRYGLTRLMNDYDYVVVDGFHLVIHALLPEETLRTLVILTPATMPDWQPPAGAERTPALILNQYENEPLSPTLDAALLNGQAQLIGKLPRYATQEDCIRKLPDDFRNCLLRLNIPLNHLTSG